MNYQEPNRVAQHGAIFFYLLTAAAIIMTMVSYHQGYNASDDIAQYAAFQRVIVYAVFAGASLISATLLAIAQRRETHYTRTQLSQNKQP